MDGEGRNALVTLNEPAWDGVHGLNGTILVPHQTSWLKTHWNNVPQEEMNSDRYDGFRRA
jgi:hypothetical protein